jgi:hypothetical protein
MNYFRWIAISLCCIILSCSSKPVATIAPPEYSAAVKQLLNKQWLEGEVTLIQDTASMVAQDITTQFPKVERDDVLILFENGTYHYDEGKSKYDSANKQVFVKGNWRVNETEKKLVLNANGSSNTYNIIEITDSTLILDLPMVQRKKSYTYRLSFKKL